ncbi:unnamed protein product [Vicia faba]|uniref:Multiple inositol polyphosphate phosphatase 1 n=1 Tax=Vicia faba TaxID=3906 RepID=A0AAV0ZG41_VICFA|nr:unnamed protein product [Vicia faba]
MLSERTRRFFHFKRNPASKTKLLRERETDNECLQKAVSSPPLSSLRNLSAQMNLENKTSATLDPFHVTKTALSGSQQTDKDTSSPLPSALQATTASKTEIQKTSIARLTERFVARVPTISRPSKKHVPGSFEKARLRFAHAETVVPFSCLLGLFLEGSEFDKTQKEIPLAFPPKPPQKRKWRGNTVAPFAGNNMLVLYSCPAPDKSRSKHFVQVLHNEHPIPMPGCHGSDFCPFEVFKEKIVAPHRKHDYDTVCNAKLEQKPYRSKILQILQWFFQLGKGDKYPKDEF